MSRRDLPFRIRRPGHILEARVHLDLGKRALIMPMKLHLHGKRGVDLLHDPRLNKGTAFSYDERDALGLRGLLPPRVTTPAMQLSRVLGNIRRKPNALEKYIYLISLQERNEALFYRRDHGQS